MIRKKKAASTPAIGDPVQQRLEDLLPAYVRKMSEAGNRWGAECDELCGQLRVLGASPDMVRSLLCSQVYDGDESKTEAAMGQLARFGFGSGSVTLRQPEPVKPKPVIPKQNLLRDLAVSVAYSAVLLSDAGVGTTTLLKAIIGQKLQYPSLGATVAIADMHGDPSWEGLERIENTVAHLPPRNPKFIENLAAIVRPVASEVQSRVAQRLIKARQPTLGSDRFPPFLLILDKWQALAEELDQMTPTQCHKDEQIRQLLKDFRYCLMTGPKVNVSVIVTSDRLSNCMVSENQLDAARIFALGAVREGGTGGYRAVDALVSNKDRIPSTRDRARLQEVLEDCKIQRLPVVVGLSGLPRIGPFNDFRDPARNLGDLYGLKGGRR